MRLIKMLLPIGMLVFVAAAGPMAAMAATPTHTTIADTAIDNDFCGTGQTVLVSFKGILNETDDWAFGHIADTWTNPETGVSVIDSVSGGGKFVAFIEDGDGAFTIVTTRQGIPSQVRMSRGPVLLQDVGLVTFYDHFAADETFLGTDVVTNGPHPDLEADFTMWCQVMTEALGL